MNIVWRQQKKIIQSITYIGNHICNYYLFLNSFCVFFLQFFFFLFYFLNYHLILHHHWKIHHWINHLHQTIEIIVFYHEYFYFYQKIQVLVFFFGKEYFWKEYFWLQHQLSNNYNPSTLNNLYNHKEIEQILFYNYYLCCNKD